MRNTELELYYWGIILQTVTRIVIVTLLLCSSYVGLSQIPFKSKDTYHHSWIPFPVAEGINVVGKNFTTRSEPGVVKIVFFLSTWCVKCQKLLPAIQALEKKYEVRDVEFTYVFLNDTKLDVEGFAKEYKLSNAILGGKSMYNAFVDIKVPALYGSDRHSDLTYMKTSFENHDLQKLEEFLKHAAVL